MSTEPLYGFNQQVTNDRNTETASAVGKGWLVAIAQILGKMADQLGKMIEDKAAKLDESIRAEKKDTTQQNAELQALTQQMNMLMQAISTIIKSIGEGNQALAKKQ